MHKFRAYDTSTSRMHDDIRYINSSINKALSSTQVIWMLSTGTISENGREIFEGDLVADDLCFVVKFGSYTDDEIQTEQIGFYLQHTESGTIGSFCPSDAKYLRVIGNIYEDPELLGEEKKEQDPEEEYVPEVGDIIEWCEEQYLVLNVDEYGEQGSVVPAGEDEITNGFFFNYMKQKSKFIRKATPEEMKHRNIIR